MKKGIFTFAALLCCFVFCFAIAADLSGKWTGKLATPGGEYPVNYTFKVDGDKLTGSGTTPNGDIPIQNGKLTGSDFTFTVLYNGTDIKNTGKFYAEADSVALDVDFQGSKMHATLTRAAN